MTALQEPQAVTTPPGTPDRRPGRRRHPWVLWTALAAAAVVFVYPFLWLVSASLKPRPEVFDNRLVPEHWAPGNYVTIWSAAPVLTWLLNSVVVALAAAVAVTISSAIVAFGFAYFRFPGRNLLFALVVGTMMLPGAVTMIPTYLIWNELGLAATQVPLWAANLFGSAFYIFLIRQFFLGVPRELFEAARVDGAGYWRLFWRIAVPLCKPALIVAFVFELRASWSDLLRPLIYLRDPQLYTMPRGMKAILDQFGQAGEARWEVVLAGAVITTVPMIVAFFLCQRYFVEGVATQGRKG
ncbi:carbohydrate ABC transporter permease [Nucisporomicrobium flavum]|uniref:carbohydrate ABC transporter permease n=1 Tax=Nucisporomicrobium flavum TaxID=2785915 RepID=UPI0018F2B382|nr:carbohydrate ABC transporter permease [Nucisporomicrobium flavum]